MDFRKSKMEKKFPNDYDDSYPEVLDLSLHHFEPKPSQSLPFAPHDRSPRKSFAAGNETGIVEDLRIATFSGVNNFGVVHRSGSGEHKNKMMGSDAEPKGSGKQIVVKKSFSVAHIMKPDVKISENRKDESVFDFQRASSFAKNLTSSCSVTGNLSVSKDITSVLPHGLPTSDSGTTGKNVKAFQRHCSDAALSEAARSSFGVIHQSEESQDLQGSKEYDEYARQLADFLKSTSNVAKETEQHVASISEESLESEACSVNIIAEESLNPEPDGASILEKDDMCITCEDGSQEPCMDVEECCEESQDSKSVNIKVAETDETAESVSALTNTTEKKRKRKVKEIDSADPSKPKRRKVVPPQTAENDAATTSSVASYVFEYQWPQEKNGDWFVLQEHITEFLGILSFKRKYPDIFRRPVDISERNFLRERGVVTEMQCDLGLTALRTDDVCDLMLRDYPEKYQEYTKLLSKRQKIADANKANDAANTEKNKMESLLRKSIKSAAEYNASLMRDRHVERRAYFDLQTSEVHYGRRSWKSSASESARMGAFPVALLPGQFQDYYKRYTSQELNYFPINTALYSPHKMLKSIFTDPGSSTIDDTEDDDGPEEANDHISISREKQDEKGGSENADLEKQKLLYPVSLEMEDGASALEDSAENSRSSFKDTKSARTPLSTRRVPRMSAKKKAREPTPKCGVCNQADKGKDAEDLVQCSDCASAGHPSCLELTKEMVHVIKTYPWQCMDCKTCVKCTEPHDEEKMMFCDRCDRGYHTFCVGLKSIPEGRWECPSCQDVPPVPPKPKRGRPFKHPRPQNLANSVTPKTEAT